MLRISLIAAVTTILLATPGTAQIAPAPASIQGQILSCDNEPVAGVDVTALSGGSAPRVTRSGPDGSFVIYGLATGTYTVCAENQAGIPVSAGAVTGVPRATRAGGHTRSNCRRE